MPLLTHMLNTAVMASHMRYQVLLSVFPVEKTFMAHLSSAGPLLSVCMQDYRKRIIKSICATTDAVERIEQQKKKDRQRGRERSLNTYTSNEACKKTH